MNQTCPKCREARFKASDDDLSGAVNRAPMPLDRTSRCPPRVAAAVRHPSCLAIQSRLSDTVFSVIRRNGFSDHR